MTKKNVIIIILSMGLFAYCTSSTKEIDNIELTPFAKELINLYITEYSQTYEIGNIVLELYNDYNEYSLYIFECEDWYKSYTENDFLGETVYLGHKIMCFGKKLDFIFKMKYNIKYKKKNTIEPMLFDPIEWEICFRVKDTTLIKESTYSFDSIGLSKINNVVEKYFKGY